MATLLSWPTVGIGDLEVFMPSPPCLIVYTSYQDDEPESSVTYLWQDENTGMLHHQLLFMEPIAFENALAWAQEHAPKRNVERIHVRHARTKKASDKTVGRKVLVGKRIAKKSSGAKAAGAGKRPAGGREKTPSKRKR